MESFEDLISGLIGLYVLVSFLVGIIQAARKARQAGGRREPEYRPVPQRSPEPPASEMAPAQLGPAADTPGAWPDATLPEEGTDLGLEGAESSPEGEPLEGTWEAGVGTEPGLGEEAEPGRSGEGFETEVPSALEGTLAAEVTEGDGDAFEGEAFEEEVRKFPDWEDERLRPTEEAVPVGKAGGGGRTEQGGEPPASRLACGLSREDLIFGIYIREVLGLPVSLRLRDARLRAAMERALYEGRER